MFQNTGKWYIGKKGETDFSGERGKKDKGLRGLQKDAHA